MRPCPDGGIGRRARLRIWWSNPCGFESLSGQSLTINKLGRLIVTFGKLPGTKAGFGKLALTGDGRVVTGGEDGRVYCARLEGGEPVALAQHDEGVRQLALIGNGRLVSNGADAVLFVIDLSAAKRCRLFASDLGLTHIAHDPAGRVIVAGDASGSLHNLPIDDRDPS